MIVAKSADFEAPLHFVLELFPKCKKLSLAVALCERFAATGRGFGNGEQMVFGVVFSGVIAGMATAVTSVAVGHPLGTTLLAYVTAGMIGSLCFIAASVRAEADVLP